MLFNSLQFCVFFPAVTLLYFFLPHRFRWMLLLAASCLFYMAFIPYYICILLVTTLVDYSVAIQLEKYEGARRRLLIASSIIVNVGFLAFFKYFNFINTNISEFARLIHWNYSIENLAIILPIGLSFHTFQAMGYTIDVYRRQQKPERHFGIFALYVMFYPQLVAGPIERSQNLIHQFYEKHVPDYARIASGLKLMLWGLFKKVVIADRVAVVVNQVYNNPHDYSGLPFVIATVFFAFQIYCDFSGYSDIAVGAAEVMGFKLMKNFDRPYFSKSIAEFWKRWHISLSTWFRDYLYIPLGGSRTTAARWQFNLFITFLVSGLWHGANWTFVIWGALNGFYLVFSLWTADIRKRVTDATGISRLPQLHKGIKVLITFCLTCVAWVFFRAANVHDALYILQHMFDGWNSMIDLNVVRNSLSAMAINKTEFIIALFFILILQAVHIMQRRGSVREMLETKPLWLRWPLWYALALIVILFGYYNSSPFIYFQF